MAMQRAGNSQYSYTGGNFLPTGRPYIQVRVLRTVPCLPYFYCTFTVQVRTVQVPVGYTGSHLLHTATRSSSTLPYPVDPTARLVYLYRYLYCTPVPGIYPVYTGIANTRLALHTRLLSTQYCTVHST